MSPHICSGYSFDGLMTGKNFILLQLPSVDTTEVTSELSKAEVWARKATWQIIQCSYFGELLLNSPSYWEASSTIQTCLSLASTQWGWDDIPYALPESLTSGIHKFVCEDSQQNLLSVAEIVGVWVIGIKSRIWTDNCDMKYAVDLQ